MQSRFELPLWYQVAQHQLSFTHFDQRFDDASFKETQIFPILALAAVYQHHPYVLGDHIIKRLLLAQPLNDRAFFSLYLYWIMHGSFKTESILEDISAWGTFERMNFEAPDNFDYEYIHQWINVLLRAFFKMGPITKPILKYKPRNWQQLTLALDYASELDQETIYINHKTISKYYGLSVMHNHLKELRACFLGQQYPTLLKPYRHDYNFFKNVVYTYWPAVLYTLQLEAAFSSEELQIVSQAHADLYAQGDFEFITHYIEKFLQVFGSDHALAQQLQKYLTPSNQTDAHRAYKFLRELTPTQRGYYFGGLILISHETLQNFTEHIQKESFENAFTTYLQINKDRMNFEFKSMAHTLCNELIMTTQVPYYCYNLADLIFHTENQYLYIFLPEELNQLTERKNPYTREILPSNLFEKAASTNKTNSLEDLWEHILRRKVDLSALL